MTDQRNRLTTDPGLGPIEVEHASTLRSIAAAAPVAEDSPGAPVYYEPKPLNAVCEHKTLELETVKLAENIDPRKLPTELSLRRPVLHLMPASDPNWPAPPAQYDSGWPPPETVLTTSQPPAAARRRSLVPLVLLVLLGASLLLVLGANARRRSALGISAQAAMPPLAASPKPVEALPTAEPAASSESAAAASASAVPPELAANAIASASAGPVASSPSARPADAPHHATFKPIPSSIANSAALSAPPTAKPKRAIY